MPEPLLRTQAGLFFSFPLSLKIFFVLFLFSLLPINFLMYKISTKLRANSVLYAEAIWSFFIAVKMSSMIKAPVKSLWLI